MKPVMKNFSNLSIDEKEGLRLAISLGDTQMTKVPSKGGTKLAYIWSMDDLEYLVVKDQIPYDDEDDDDFDDEDDFFDFDVDDDYEDFPE